MAAGDQIVVMGVSGSGKTTLGKGIAAAMGWPFADGDTFHSEANLAKLSAGIPLTDEDRWPWLEAIGGWLDSGSGAGAGQVVACSALRRRYRDLLRAGRARVRFCHIRADPELTGYRVARRKGHVLAPSLLPSQLATLEPLQADEPGVTVSATGRPEDVVRRALAALDLEASTGRES